MKILYFGGICDKVFFKFKEAKQHPSFIAHYMFESALYEELLNKKDVQLSVYSINQTPYFPEDRLMFYKKNHEGINYLPFINVPYLKEISFFIITFVYILLWALKNHSTKDKIVLLNINYPPVTLAISIATKLLSIKKVITLTDLPIYVFSKKRVDEMKLYKKIIIKPYINMINKTLKLFDAYILFSESMNEIVNPSLKPWIVIEGIFNSDKLNLSTSEKKTNAIAHAGTLNKEKGLLKIFEVFDSLDDANIELWIFGKGDMENEIIEMSKVDRRIKYFGFLPRNDVFNYLKESKLLVNLRDPKELYTKYSFPSKMFEYMATGTPVLTTKLDGIPKEYYNYLFTIDSYDTNIICDTIKNLLYSNSVDIETVGIKAKDFVINKKNSQYQVEKMMDFIIKVHKNNLK